MDTTPEPRTQAEWEPLLSLALLVTRNAVDADERVKSACRGAVRTGITSGALDAPSDRRCLVCGGLAAHWHHPSYAQGFRDVVQPVCTGCHARGHAAARAWFKNRFHPDSWFCVCDPERESPVAAFLDALDAAAA